MVDVIPELIPSKIPFFFDITESKSRDDPDVMLDLSDLPASSVLLSNESFDVCLPNGNSISP